jgi:hypothetical protein
VPGGDALRATLRSRTAGAWTGATAGGTRTASPLLRCAAPGSAGRADASPTWIPLPQREHRWCARGGRHGTITRGAGLLPPTPPRCTGFRSSRVGRAGRVLITRNGYPRLSFRRRARDTARPWHSLRSLYTGRAGICVQTKSQLCHHWHVPPNLCGRMEASDIGGWWESPPRGPALRAERLALAALEPSRTDVLVGGLAQKKGAHRPSLGPKTCPPPPSPRNSSCLPLWRYTIIRGTMSLCLVGGGQR